MKNWLHSNMWAVLKKPGCGWKSDSEMATKEENFKKVRIMNLETPFDIHTLHTRI